MKVRAQKHQYVKKIYHIALVMLLVCVFTACGGSEEAAQTSKESETSVVEPKAEKKEKNEIVFEEIQVVENEECSIKITDIDPDNMWGYTLKTDLENKSPEKTYMVSVTSAAVNGVQCDPFFATEVAPGKKAIGDISFSDAALKENGVGDFTDIELSFRVYDSNDWMADPVAEETIHIYPYGEEKAAPFVRERKASDVVLLDNEYVSMTVTDIEAEGLWGYTLNLFLENKTDKEVMFSVDEASVNGYMADPFYASSLLPGKCAFSSMSWANSTLEELGITGIEEIEFKLRAYDYESFDQDYAEEVIILNP